MGNSSSVLDSYRTQLSKEGKRQLDEFVAACLSRQLPFEELQQEVTTQVRSLLKSHRLPPILLIELSKLVKLGRFPRCPDDIELTSALTSIDRDNSLLIFISHCWMRGWSGAEGWDGRPHPDNAHGDKYKLCVAGIENIKNNLAHRFRNCYVWLDFGCINQDGNPAGELEQLDKIVECCDAIFTPIVDLEHESWRFPTSIVNWFDEYKAKLWNDGPHAYLNRGWCRVEMLYAANIPVLQNKNSEVKRHTMLEAGFAIHCSENRRPHFLYGNKEMAGLSTPRTLPPLQHTYFTDYHPLKGHLSVQSDIEHIKNLIADLQPYMDSNKLNAGYEGQVNEKGERHGRGTLRYPNSEVYDGEWSGGNRHGSGTHRYACGDIYTGDWRWDKRDGHGEFKYASGDRYDGQWRNDIREGGGTYRYANGDLYEGGWKADHKSGRGVYKFADGGEYEGDFAQDVMNGRGRFRYALGDTYEGEWRNSAQEGHGTYHFGSGDVYTGRWKANTMDGRGTMRFHSGDTYEGDWKEGARSGQCVTRYANGDVYKGGWEGEARQGWGTLKYADGNVLSGIWNNDDIAMVEKRSKPSLLSRLMCFAAKG